MQTHELEADLLVAGGGMAGVCAALAAARQGAKVVLVQDRSVLGGNASSEVRMHIVGADCSGSRSGWRETGLIEELRLEDALRNPDRCFPFWDVLLYEKVNAEPNITLLLDTDVVGAQVEYAGGADNASHPPRTQRMYEFSGRKGRIVAAYADRQLTEDRFIIRAKMYADCTGDGRLGFEAGADFRIGRESQQMHGESMAQPQDDIHTLGNSILLTSKRTDRPVPFKAPPWVRKLNPEQLKVGRGIYSWEYGFWWIEWGGMQDTIKDNCTVIRHELYAIALGVWDYVKNSGLFPESSHWNLDWIGAIPGKRESRRFLGPHILTQQDLQQAVRFPDEAAYGGWTIDLHPVAGMDAITEHPCSQTPLPEPFPIPLRSYFSRNIANLFFAGRNISATHVAFASTRVMATCAIGGQAVGVAAALCAQSGTTPAELVAKPEQVGRFQQALLDQDATLLHTPLANSLVHTAKLAASSQQEGSEVQKIRDGWIRDQYDPKGPILREARGWRSAGFARDGQPWFELTWDQPVEIREIHLTFDTGLLRPLSLTPSDHFNSRSIRGPQPETLRHYRLELDGVVAVEEKDNYQRKQVHRLDQPRRVNKLRLVALATHGIDEARVLELAVK